MNTHLLIDSNGNTTPFFPGLEVVHTDESGRERRGVVVHVGEDPIYPLGIVLDESGARIGVPAKHCHAPDDAAVRIDVEETRVYSFRVPLSDLDEADVREGFVETALDTWFCDRDRPAFEATYCDTVAREITGGTR